MTNSDETNNRFHEVFYAHLATTPKADKLVALGEFNARVWTDRAACEGLLGPYCLGSCDDNDLLLLQTCAKLRLLLSNTLFHLRAREKATWMYPR
ncbi:unnamed protein product [Schistocephalus solidus]|uniref:Endo/exonuclease/phosphatase domain-containing protein n=1 Tax=Schistocephalus solidus TaxID=70667 RepID=A0A183T2S5_SCHSO|nr:unnamed protein product [Schistocephalus solidus]